MRARSGWRAFAVVTPVAGLLVLALVQTVLANAAFNANPVPGEPLTVQFTDLSAPGPLDWEWSFGDGAASTERNPRHVYPAAGEYVVGLRVRLHEIDSWTETGERTIAVAGPLEASFAWEVIGPLTVRFTDTSSGDVTARHWTAGDGNSSDTDDRVWVHTYARPGDYIATLAVSGPYGAFDKEIRTITVPSPPVEPPAADFSFSPSNGTAPLTVRFDDRSTGADAWQWSFGDGSASAEPNPSHTFGDARDYEVSLTVSNDGGTDTVRKTVIVDRARTPTPPVSQSPIAPPALVLYPSSTPPFTVTVEGTATAGAGATIARIGWTWGDDTVEDHAVPNSHVYAASGPYTITVTAFQSDGQSTTRSMPVFVNSPIESLTPTEPPPDAPAVAAFTWAPDAANRLRIHFTDTSTGPVTARRWEFGDGTTSTDPNPAHVYVRAGPFAVRLTVEGPGGTSTTARNISVGGQETPPVTPTTVPPTVTVTVVTPTVTEIQPPPTFPWWLVAVAAVGLLAGGVALVKGVGRFSPSQDRVPGLTVEARGGLRRPNAAPKRKEAEIGIEVRGGMRRER
ncbi:MAG: PKD domain-containing protein [Methanospirillum sp.]